MNSEHILAVLGVVVAYPHCGAGGYVVVPILGVIFWTAWSRG